MKITGIRLRKATTDTPMKAIATITLDDQLAIHDVKIIVTENKRFVVMPSRKSPDGAFRDLVHPVNAEFRREVEEELFKAYDAFCEEEAETETKAED